MYQRVLTLFAAILIGAALYVSVSAFLPTAPRAAFTVDSTLDAVDAAPGDGSCAAGSGECTLRAAVMESNALPGADTILLPAGVYTLTLPGTGEDGAASGDLDIAEDLTISGDGPDVTVIDAAGLDRIFHVLGDGDPYPGGGIDQYIVQLQALTVRGGHVEAVNLGGGGLANQGGRVTLSAVTVADNLVYADAAPGLGGGITNQGLLTVTDSLIAGNGFSGIAPTSGGGIYNSGYLYIVSSQVLSNSADAGGGITISQDFVNAILTTTVAYNHAYTGGGIAIGLAYLLEVDLHGSRIEYNSACIGGGLYVHRLDATDFVVQGNRLTCSTRQGSGILVKDNTTLQRVVIADNLNGPGIWHDNGTLIMSDSTVSGNPTGLAVDNRAELTNVTISNNGTGVERVAGGYGSLKLTHVTLAFNDVGIFAGSGSITLRGTLLAENGTGCTIPVTSAGYNIENTATCGLSAAGDRMNSSVPLPPLADNGGGTLTHALPYGSLAVDAVPSGGCPATDQRGVARPADGNGDGTFLCDVGAFEFEDFVPTDFLHLPGIVIR